LLRIFLGDDSDGSPLYYCMLLDLVNASLGRFRRLGTFNRGHDSNLDIYMGWYGYGSGVLTWRYDETTSKHVIVSSNERGGIGP